MNEALRNLNSAIQESAAVIQFDQLPQVWAERSQLVQVFQNLIGNAIKFRGAGAADDFDQGGDVRSRLASERNR